MKTTSFVIFTMALTIIFSWVDPSGVLSKQITNREKDLRQEGQYLALLEQTPDAIETRLLLAQLYSKKNRYGKAIIHYEKALASGNQRPGIYIDLAFCQEQMGNVDEAIQTCLQGITANPQNSELHLRLGNLYHQRGMDDEAEKEYTLSRELRTEL